MVMHKLAWATVHVGPTTTGAFFEVARVDMRGLRRDQVCISLQHRLESAATPLPFLSNLIQCLGKRLSYWQRHTHAYT